MATLFSMYKDVASPDVTSDIRESRRESETNTKKTQDTAFGMLKRSNAGTLQQEYRAGSGRFKGITDPDKKFQVYYDALKALDPQAAQDAGKIYAEERQRKINADVADAYKAGVTSGNTDIDAIKAEIDKLSNEIRQDETKIESDRIEAEAAARGAEELAKMSGYKPQIAGNIHDFYPVANIPNIIAQGKAEDNMVGYKPQLSNIYRGM